MGNTHGTAPDTVPASYAQSGEETAFGVKEPNWEMRLPGSWPASSPRHWPRHGQQRPALPDLPASPGSIYSSQMCLADGRGQGAREVLCLSSALSYALPSAGRCRPFPGQDSGCRNEESRAKGDTSNPPTPREAGRAAVQARSSCRGLQEGSGGAFQDTCSAVVPGYCFGFFSWHLP